LISALNAIAAPSLKRRLASMLYEAMLVFAVLFAAVLLFSTAMEQRHALYLRNALQSSLFVVLGLYFIWFWSHGGQTLAMKTWRIRLVDRSGKSVKIWRAVARYLLAWLWFLPGLALAWLLGAKTSMLMLIPLANVVLWALAIYLDPQRQFLHDRLAGTRLIAVEPPAKTFTA
jgi:uncharacterized RDD family membrane protein YckC